MIIDKETLMSSSSTQSEQMSSELITRATHAIKAARHVCILTGAGISAESGIPTFRDKQSGLWERFSAEELANIEAFDHNPQLVWSWYQWRRGEVKDKKPNPAHLALATWQQRAGALGHQLSLITQNVDDLHEQAGSQAIHLHGQLYRNHCSGCGLPYEQDIDTQITDLVSCPACGGHIRPSIVWFGEMLPQDAWHSAQSAAEQCEVFISIGTSSLVYPAAGLVQLAKTNGATIIEINPNPTDNQALGLVDIQIPYPAGQVMPVLMQQLTGSI